MKFSAILTKPHERKKVTLPLPGATFVEDGGAGKWEGPTVDLDVRAISGTEPDDIQARALEYARERAKGEILPNMEELVERGRILHTLVAACIDTDSPENAPAPFFDGGVAAIGDSPVMLPELVAYLYEQQQLHQDEVNPLLREQTPAEFVAAVIATAQGDMSFFVSMRPGMLWSFTHSMAKLLEPLMTAESQPSSPSEPQTPTEP